MEVSKANGEQKNRKPQHKIMLLKLNNSVKYHTNLINIKYKEVVR